MPRLHRPDGVELSWEQRGAEEHPLIVFAFQFFGFAAVLEGLVSDLAADHRVVTYDLRGTGQSTPRGPYDLETDAGDLGALIDHVGGPGLVVAMGDGTNRAVKVAAEHPDLLTAIVTPGGNPVGRAAARGSEALVDSPSVIEALLNMIATDYRGALRTMIASANPQMTEQEARERVDLVVAYCPQEVGAARLRAWIDDDVLDETRAMGDRMIILSHSNNAWFPAAAVDRTRELLPDVQIIEVADGPISRPDLTADVVRRVTSGRPAEASQR